MDDLDRSIQKRIDANPDYQRLLEEEIRRLRDYVPDPEREDQEFAQAEAANPDPVRARRVLPADD